MVLVEQQYKDIRKKLDEMGFHQPCSTESVLLVSKILNDLCNTQDKLLIYEDATNTMLRKTDEMDACIKVYKKENERLIKENNKIHSDIIFIKDEAEKKSKELKKRINELENMYSDLEFNYMEQMAHIGVLRQELLMKTKVLYELGVNVDENEKIKSINESYANDNLNNDLCNYASEMEVSKKRQGELMAEIELLESQLEFRNTEIARLRQELEEKSCIYTSNEEKKCYCHTLNTCHSSVNAKSIANLQERVKSASSKEHDAMERAINLADQNEFLRKEIRCLTEKLSTNNRFSYERTNELLQKHNTETMNKIYEMENRIENLQVMINNLKKENENEKEKNIILEKEKNTLNEKVSNLKMIEKDLSSEIDRLQQKNADLKDDIAHLVDKNKNEELPANSLDVPKNTRDAEANTRPLEKDSINEKIKAERDYFCNELHRLREKLLNADFMHREAKCCSNLDCGLDLARVKKLQQENLLLQEEIMSLKHQIMTLSNSKYDFNRLMEGQLKKLELDKDTLSNSNNDLKKKWQNSEQHVEQLRKKIDLMTNEIEERMIKYNHLKKININLDLAVKNSQAATKRAQMDLIDVTAKIKELESKLKNTLREVILVKKEKQEVKENLIKLDREKDEILLKMDEKTVLVSKLDRSLQLKNSQIKQLENEKSKLISHVQKMEKILHSTEGKYRDHDRNIRKMEHEILTLQSYKENLSIENQTLQRELFAATQDVLLTNQALEKSRKESEDLKRELQTYVDEVRRVEKILQEKEREREGLLEQFNALSAEASHLEDHQQSLKYEASYTKDTLIDTQNKLSTLQKEVHLKDSEVSNMQHQVSQLTDQIVHLQSRVSEMSDREFMLTSDLDTARNLCSSMEDKKQQFREQLEQISSQKKLLQDELERIENENDILQQQLREEQNNSNTLENMLTMSRHEALEKSMCNEDLSKDMKQMKETILSLESKLNSVQAALSECQNTCANYHCQNVQLRRQITNEQFERAKDLDSNSTSL